MPRWLEFSRRSCLLSTIFADRCSPCRWCAVAEKEGRDGKTGARAQRGRGAVRKTFKRRQRIVAATRGRQPAGATCGYVRISYNSCRDRHCPKCQGAQRAAWLESRLQRLLPVEYFHVVFTLPDGLYPLILQNKAVLYDLLFATAAQT